MSLHLSFSRIPSHLYTLIFSLHHSSFHRIKRFGDKHLCIFTRDLIPSIHLLSHRDYVVSKQLYIDTSLKEETDPVDYLFVSLKAAQGCNFIIFSADETRFAQYWISHGGHIMSYAITGKNELGKHINDFLELLDEYDIKYMETVKDSLPPEGYFMIMDRTDILDYEVNFGEDTSLVAGFTKRMIAEVYDDDLTKVDVVVG